jgi:hypothetical protein
LFSVLILFLQKATLLSSKALAVTDSGEITNLMSADSTQIVNLGRWLALGFIAPLDILGVFIFLGVIIGPSTLVVLGVLIVSLPINGVVANSHFSSRKRAAPLTDLRLKASGEFIKHIRAIKFSSFFFFGPFLKKVIKDTMRGSFSLSIAFKLVAMKSWLLCKTSTTLVHI